MYCTIIEGKVRPLSSLIELTLPWKAGSRNKNNTRTDVGIIEKYWGGIVCTKQLVDEYLIIYIYI